jgi:hypothetical protein
MRRARIGLLLVLIPAIASAAYLLGGSSEDAGAPPAPHKIETPQSTPAEPSDDSHSHAPQQSTDEVIGVPMFA